MTEELADKRDYELSFLVQREEAAREVQRLLAQHGGEMASEGQLRKIQLAYPVKKETEAYFGFLSARLHPASAKLLERDLETSAAVLRFLIIRLPSSRAVSASLQRPRVRPPFVRREPSPEPQRRTASLSNEALEKKIEEILQ
ncbi:30S ribosomal protein S6 [Candidatus Parcubacteria bacterium]|nr:MAG: 30S ribosomal protein S6 [Candidatus Parcubacteria bacterium]